MPIPSEIRGADIQRAIESLKASRDWGFRASTKFCLVGDGDRHYPPKLVISIASRYATGSELSSHVFNGGHESNEFLTRRGFRTVLCPFVDGKPFRDRRRPHSG